MAFSRKIFIAVFLTTLVIGTSLIWAAHSYVRNQTYENFLSRYTVFSRVLSDTLSRLDFHTEDLMYNAAKVVAEHDTHEGLLSTKVLKRMSQELNVTHIFVINKKGEFIRSTNEDPKLIPNAYSFCPQYRDMITGNVSRHATPIVHPQPEPKPYKFLFVPNENRERLLEVGVRVDFIAKTLTDALGSDTSVLSMALYDPHGTSFGRFSAKEYQWSESKLALPDNFPAVIDGGTGFKFYTKVASSQPRCCQCDVSKTSKNGEYYYILESVISKKELSAVLATTKTTFFLFGLGNLILAFIFGRLLSRRLVKNIETAAQKVREIKAKGHGRIDLDGKDEVSYLTKEFDHLMDSLEDSQKKIIEAEKVQTKVQLAKEVAHNIKSPIIAIEMMLPLLASAPERIQRNLKNSVMEIRALADRLRAQAASSVVDRVEDAVDLLYLPVVLEETISQKQLEYSGRNGVTITLENRSSLKNSFVQANAIEFKSILSNLINNAVESYGTVTGQVSVTLNSDEAKSTVSVRDYGVGIPEEYLSQIGMKQFTFKGESGRGMGLMHAFKTVDTWGGSIEVESALGEGTLIRITLPTYQGPKKRANIAEFSAI